MFCSSCVRASYCLCHFHFLSLGICNIDLVNEGEIILGNILHDNLRNWHYKHSLKLMKTIWFSYYGFPLLPLEERHFRMTTKGELLHGWTMQLLVLSSELLFLWHLSTWMALLLCCKRFCLQSWGLRRKFYFSLFGELFWCEWWWSSHTNNICNWALFTGKCFLFS